MLNHDIKTKTRNHFNKAASTYDEYCDVQNEICNHLINQLYKYQTQFNHIADFACGTGESTKKLIDSVKYKKCYGMDFSENLLLLAQHKLEDRKIVFIQGDFEERILDLNLDLIFCNMGLQWCESLFNTIKLWHDYLIQQGILLFSIPIEGNFPEMQPAHKLLLPTHNEIIKTLKAAEFELMDYDIKTISFLFPNQLSLLKSLKNVGANYNKSTNANLGLQKIKPQHIFTTTTNRKLTYRIGIYLARKK